MKVKLIQSRDKRKYQSLIRGFRKEFGKSFEEAINDWCNKEPIEKGAYWQVWLMVNAKTGEVIGITGLYSLPPYNNFEVFLGWFGILPKYRKMRLGTDLLKWTSAKAKRLGYYYLSAEMNRDRKPWKFYNNNGFFIDSKVSSFVKQNNGMTADLFISRHNIVITKAIYE